MGKVERVTIIVLDSVGAGELPDANLFDDCGSNTLGNMAKAYGGMSLPNMGKLGLGNITEIYSGKAGDFIVGEFVFEIGGAKKGFEQIKDMPNSFIAADDIEVGVGNKIPLWLFGFLY